MQILGRGLYLCSVLNINGKVDVYSLVISNDKQCI